MHYVYFACIHCDIATASTHTHTWHWYGETEYRAQIPDENSFRNNLQIYLSIYAN